MENNRITQQNSSEPNSNQPPSSRRRWDLTNSSFLVNLIRFHPWLLWIAVIAFLFTTINLSLLSITQSGYVKDEEPKPTPVVTEPEATSQTDNSVLLWLLVVVILGSGSSAIAIAKLLPILSQSQLYQRFHTSTKAFSRRKERKLQLQSKQQTSFIPIASEVVSSPTISVLPSESQEQFIVEERILIVLDDQPLTAASEVQLLDESVPFPENESLNSDLSQENATTTESLAEMLDIRKKLPLSTILGESFYKLEEKK